MASQYQAITNLKQKYSLLEQEQKQLLSEKQAVMRKYVKSIKQPSDTPQIVSLTQLLETIEAGTEEQQAQAIVMLGEIGDQRAKPKLDAILKTNSPEWIKQLAQDSLDLISRKAT